MHLLSGTSRIREIGFSLPLCMFISHTRSDLRIVIISYISRARRQEVFQIALFDSDSHVLQVTVSISCDGSPLSNVVKHALSQSASVSAFVHS